MLGAQWGHCIRIGPGQHKLSVGVPQECLVTQLAYNGVVAPDAGRAHTFAQPVSMHGRYSAVHTWQGVTTHVPSCTHSKGFASVRQLPMGDCIAGLLRWHAWLMFVVRVRLMDAECV